MTELTLEQAGALAPTVTAAEAAKRVADGALLVDVRSEAGRLGSGSITGAVVVGKDQVDQKFGIDSADRLPEIQSTRTPVVIVCGSVLGSGPVAAQLLAGGYTDVVQVEGGFPAWKDAGLPTESIR